MTIRMISLAVAAALAMCGCGGGGGGTTATPSGVAKAISSGVITTVDAGTGSAAAAAQLAKTITVNNTTFALAGAPVTMDDVDGAVVTDPKPGMVAEVTGDVSGGGNTGTASAVIIQDSIKGPVASIDPDYRSLVVLGQTITLDAATIFGNVSSATRLKSSDMVVIHGLTDSAGTITATRVEKLGEQFVPDVTPLKVRGTVTSVTGSTSGSSFTIGSLTVQTTGALPGGVVEGAVVQVKGTAAVPEGPLTARRIKVKNVHVADTASVEIDGYVTDFVSASSFTVGGIPVDCSGVTVTGTAANARVEVEGKIVDGVLVATDVKVKGREGTKPATGPPSQPGTGHGHGA
jgi:Domain of unknown function (DUF5666)